MSKETTRSILEKYRPLLISALLIPVGLGMAAFSPTAKNEIRSRSGFRSELSLHPPIDGAQFQCAHIIHGINHDSQYGILISLPEHYFLHVIFAGMNGLNKDSNQRALEGLYKQMNDCEKAVAQSLISGFNQDSIEDEKLSWFKNIYTKAIRKREMCSIVEAEAFILTSILDLNKIEYDPLEIQRKLTAKHKREKGDKAQKPRRREIKNRRH